MRKTFSCSVFLLAMIVTAAAESQVDKPLAPRIDGDFWQIAGDPDLGKYTSPGQQPVDFGIWQAADGTWQLWSCIRSTKLEGKTRLFYRWQADKLTDRDWTPMGIAMLADPNFGETEGGLQAPYVMRQGPDYYMFYGTWEHIALAKSKDGKTFARQLMADGKSGIFSEGEDANTRDPMVVQSRKRFYIYYTAYPKNHGADYARTSKDLVHWGASTRVAYGGSAGDGPYAAECPFVYYHEPSRLYYLFRTQRYGVNAQTSVYASKDPFNFGLGIDTKLVETLPYAAPEIITVAGETYLAVLLPSLKGIQVAKLKWTTP